MTYIKTLTAPLIIIAGLALLTACGGAATPAEETAVDCTEAPFDSVNMCEDEKITACQMHGTNVDAGGHASCDDRINMACTEDPFVYNGCDTLDDAIRNNFCALPDNRFNAGCITNNLGGDGRMTFCEMPDNRFNADCIANNLGGGGRTTFCEMPANIFTHAKCMDLGNINDIRMTFCEMPDNRFNADCITNNLGGGGRTTFCDMPTNRFNADCIANNLGGGGRTTFCEMPDNRFNADCIANNLGGGGRTTFCEMPANIFTHAECMNISNINNIRMTFCEMPANLFDQECIDRDLGDNERDTFCDILPTNLFNQDCLDNGLGDHDGDRDTACLSNAKGSPQHPSCANRPGVITACQMNPFNTTNTGCENLDTIISIKEVYCGTAANFAKDICTVNYDDWEASFGTGKAPELTPNTTTRRNEFLNAGTDALDAALDEVFPDEHAETATTLHLGELKGGDATDGVAYFIFQDSGQQYHYAGLDSQTDLGAPSFQETGTAIWKGRFNATKLDQATEFELEITFGGTGDVAGSIAAFVPSGANHFLLTGDYDENGVISGTVDYGVFTTGTRTPMDTADTRQGFLTGLIGRQGAIGVFVSGTAIDNNGVITGGTSGTTGFAGGFVANPFEGNVSYSDWVSSSSPPATPAAAPPGDNLNQFVQTIRNDVIKAAHVGQNFNVNLSSLDGDPADGFSVYHVTATDDYLVGLSATTSLGAVLTRATGTGSWKGSFVAYEGGVATTTPFELTIDFAERNINTTITGTDYTFTNTSFGSANGVIRGTVNRGTTTGSLAGLIGLGGAVGVFHSDNNLEFSYAGGFVAASPAFDGRVNYADWLASFNPAPATTPTAGTSAFLQATGSTLSTEGLRTSNNVGSIIINTLNLSTAEYENNPLDGDAEDGVAFFQGYSESGSDFYAGIFDTTNLGPPITASDASATWRGRFQAINTTPVNKNFTLDVIFGDATDAAGSVKALVKADATFSYFVEGTFSDRGVITGTSIFGPFTTEETKNGIPGVLTGLIGQEGAVGAFHSNLYGGGFVARKAP